MGATCSAPGVVDDDNIRVFWTGHLTKGHEERHIRWLGPVGEFDVEVKASMPPFNNANQLEIPDHVKTINAPAFGVNISNAVMRMFAMPEMAKVASELGVQLPANTLSKFVQSKMPKVIDMIQHARADPKLKGLDGAIDKLERFVEDFKELKQDDIQSMDQWNEFVHKHTSRGWQNKLHFDHLLSNFEFNKNASDQLRQATIMRKDDSGEEKEVSFEHHSFRWLSKAFAAYGPEMALSDVVNAIFAMTKDSYENVSDVDVAKKIDAFHEKILHKNFAGLWIPSHLFMDAACDDCMVWVLLTYVYKNIKTERKLKVLVQLPGGEQDGDELLVWLVEKLRAVGVVECEVWLDPDSRNRKEIKHYWEPQMRGATPSH